MGKKKVIKRFMVRKIVRGPSAKKRAAQQGLPRVVESTPVVTPDQIPASKVLLTLEDRHLIAMISDPRYTAAIPCLARGQGEMQKGGKRCGRCNKKRARLRSSVLKDIRNCLVSMGPAHQAAFKALAGAQKVRVMVISGAAVKPMTF